MKNKSKPKLFDLITTLSQSNVETSGNTQEKESKKKLDNFFPYVPSEELTLTSDEESSKKEEESKSRPTIKSDSKKQHSDDHPNKKEFKKKHSSISLELILREDTLPPLSDSNIPTEVTVEREILLRESPPEHQDAKAEAHDKSENDDKRKVEEEAIVVEEENQQDSREQVTEPEPKFSKINIGDEPKKTVSKPVNKAKKESKNVEFHDAKDSKEEDRRVSSAGSSSSSSSGELYVGKSLQCPVLSI